MSVAKGASAAYAAPEVMTRFRQNKSSLPGDPDAPSPEVLKAADTYSFAIVLMEVCIRSPPWLAVMEMLNIDQSGNQNPQQVLEKAMINGVRPIVPPAVKPYAETDKVIKFLSSIMDICWLSDPESRPTMDVVQKTIGRFRTDTLEPLSRKQVSLYTPQL